MSEELEADDLASLDVESIEGIGGQAAERLGSVNINTIEDLDACDPRALYEKANLSLYKLMEYRRKAQMVLSVSQALKDDEPTLKTLGENGYSITKTIEEDIAVLADLTNQSPDHLQSLQNNLLLLLIGLEDRIARKKGSIGLVRKTRRRRRRTEDEDIPGPEPEPESMPEPRPEPTARIESPTLEMAKTAISGGVGGLIGGGLGAAGYLHTLVAAGLGAIVGIGTWVALYFVLKE